MLYHGSIGYLDFTISYGPDHKPQALCLELERWVPLSESLIATCVPSSAPHRYLTDLQHQAIFLNVGAILNGTTIRGFP